MLWPTPTSAGVMVADIVMPSDLTVEALRMPPLASSASCIFFKSVEVALASCPTSCSFLAVFASSFSVRAESYASASFLSSDWALRRSPCSSTSSPCILSISSSGFWNSLTSLVLESASTDCLRPSTDSFLVWTLLSMELTRPCCSLSSRPNSVTFLFAPS